MQDNDRGGFDDFIRKNFKLLKVKDSRNMRMGRRTLAWLLGQEKKARLSHLTMERLDGLKEKYGLAVVAFDDGYTYMVKPGEERGVMVEFYASREMDEGIKRGQVLIDDVPVSGDDLLESYRITDRAVEAITGDSLDDLDIKPGAVVDFISCDTIEQWLEDGGVRIFMDEGIFTVLAENEEAPEGETYPLHLATPLPGSEVPLSRLDLKKTTAITGRYRDEVGSGSHDLEHNITRMND